MYDKIVLIDNVFPFEKGEEFLENEIKYCREYCKELIMIPINASDFSKSRIQENKYIKTIKHNYKRNKLERYLSCMYTLHSPHVQEEAWIHFKQKKQGLRKALQCVSYFEMGEYLTNVIAKEIRGFLQKDEKILFYSYWLDKCAFVAGRLKKLYPNAAAVSRAHRCDIYAEERNIFLPYRRYIYNMLDKICPVSENGEHYIKARYPEFSSKIQTFYLGTEDYGRNGKKKEGSFHIVSCSGLSSVKRIGLLIRALERIRDIEILWDHYGDGPLRKVLEKEAETVLADNIIWKFHGYVSNCQLMKIYREKYADIFVNVSESEGVPVSIMEALSFGIPVIATNVGGTGEIVIHNRNGILMDKNFNLTELTEAIRRFAGMEESEYEQFRKNARLVWEEKVNSEKNYRLFYENI